MVESWAWGGRGRNEGENRTGSVPAVDKIIPGTGGHSLGKEGGMQKSGKEKKKNCQSFTNQMQVPEKYHTGQ